MKSASALIRLLAVALATCLPGSTHAATLFEDGFDTDTSANWRILTGYYASTSSNDFTAEFAFDYSQQTYLRYAPDGVTYEELFIPPAPGSRDGSTRGLKLTVNQLDELPERIAVNLYPVGQSFSGDYVLKFDLWMNYNGAAGNGVGSTEHFLAGINHSGEIVNWHSFTASFTEAAAIDGAAWAGVGAEASDGIWFAYTGEGGAAVDGCVVFGTTNGPGAYWGSTAIPEINQSPDVLPGFLDRDGDGSPDNSNVDAWVASTLFPHPRFETPGAPGKRWVEVEISQIGNVITWKFDGKIFARFENPTDYTSGNIMIGMMDIFTSIPSPPEENFILFDNLRVESVRTVVVTTTDNSSGPDDGETSLAEALADLEENDRITFNIPGDGPHVIATPIGGYPLITRDGVVIDGYTQPGASPNSQPLLDGNNAVLRIVLDSSSDATAGDPALPDRASTRLPYPGYGDSENAILGILEADHVTIRGLSFLGRHTAGTDDDPAIYAIALVNGARRARIQGNWFGLHPDGTTVQGVSSAVAAFRHRVDVDGVTVDTFSEGLTVGTDSDGIDDLAEFNILCGHHIALALELPEAITAGNYFNVLPDGRTFVDIEEIHQQLLATGRGPGDASVENYENGRDTTGSVIGVRGDGVNDENEPNIFHHAIYESTIQFYTSASNIVVAGNYFGVGVDGTTTAPVPTSMTPNFIDLPGSGSIRIGSDNDGVADDLEGNRIFNIPGFQFAGGGLSVPVVARRNRISGAAFDAFPFSDGSEGRTYADYYAPYVQESFNVIPVLTEYADGLLSGTYAVPWDEYFADVDIYVADPDAQGGVMPGTYLGTFFDDGPEDLDLTPGAFTFDLSGLAVPGGRELCVVITYSLHEAESEFATSVTSPVSNTVETGGSASDPIGELQVSRDGSNLVITWEGGTPPFQVQRRSELTAGAWEDLGEPTEERTATVAISGDHEFFRVQGQ